MNARALSRGTLLLFALPAVLQGFTHTVAGQVLSGIYAKYFGLSLTALGGAVLFCKIADAVLDPAIGALSDRARRRHGKRKTWVLLGSLLTAAALWLLLRPASGVTVAYFTLWYLVVYIGWSLTEIPYRAWSAELTKQYQERTTIGVWILVMSLLGAVGVFLVPIIANALGTAADQKFTPQSLAICSVIIVVATPLLAGLTFARVPEGVVHREHETQGFRELSRTVLQNRPLLTLNLVFLLQSLASGMTNGVAFLYMDVYMGLGEKLAALLLVTVPIAIISAPVWGWLCNRYEKHRAWAVAIAGGSIASGLLGVVEPGDGALVPLVILLLLNFFFGAATGVAMPSMMGDVVDHGRLMFGRDNAGTYYSFFTFIQKSITGLGMGLGMMMIGWFGFDATASEQSMTGIFGIKMAYAFVPAVVGMLAVPLLLRHEITRARHAQIVRELERIDAGVRA